jgi:iron(II)-dependent oxidoreductase
MLPLNDLHFDHSIAASIDGDRAVTAPTAQNDRANRASVAGDLPVGGDLVGRDKWQDGYANVEGYADPSGTTAVTTFAMAASPYGCLDLLGNVQEWTGTAWGDDEPPTAYGVRGGSYRSRPNALRCSTRESIHPDAKVAWRGFRVILFIT